MSFLSSADPFPSCSFQDVVTAPSGEVLTLRCLVDRAKPAPTLTWGTERREINPKPLPTTFAVLSDDGRSWNVNTSLTFTPDPEDDGKAVSLTLESPAWTGSRKVVAALNVTCESN